MNENDIYSELIILSLRKKDMSEENAEYKEIADREKELGKLLEEQRKKRIIEKSFLLIN